RAGTTRKAGATAVALGALLVVASCGRKVIDFSTTGAHDDAGSGSSGAISANGGRGGDGGTTGTAATGGTVANGGAMPNDTGGRPTMESNGGRGGGTIRGSGGQRPFDDAGSHAFDAGALFGPCTTNMQCPPFLPECDAATGRCVQCTSDMACPSGWVCDQVFKQCGFGCNKTTAPCQTGLKCSDSRRICVECDDDMDCSSTAVTGSTPTGAQYCVLGVCVQCSVESQCASPLHCDQKGSCVECRTNDDCTTGNACMPFTERCEPTN
ncbi:MAG TPA: hypothetical protein VH142_20810, partial [Polyangiaceae bacterium]|nr:hypothetical protein [Polyangiaceae bacterium]